MIKIVHGGDLQWGENRNGTPPGYATRYKRLALEGGGKRLGCSLIELAPGNKSVPFHAHLGNEEALYVLEGEGVIRLVDGEHAIRAGDYVALPQGPESAHQVINRSAAPLRFLAMSTMDAPDIVVYPDSRKVFAIAGAPPGGVREERTLSALYPMDAQVDYWKGET